MMNVRILFFVVMINVMMLARGVRDFPALLESDLDSMTINTEKIFDGNSLWGHINGGADLYLEYGFDKLLLQNVEYNGISFRVEFYKMKSAEAAFGIFSIKRYKCVKSFSIPVDVCITGNHIQAAMGRYYISISNEVETEEALDLSYELFQKILNKSKELPFLLPEILCGSNLKESVKNIKFISGTLGLQNGFPMWELMFENIENYSVYIIPITDKPATIGLINFKVSSNLDQFLLDNDFETPEKDELIKRKAGEDFVQIILLENFKILYLESENESLPILDYININ